MDSKEKIMAIMCLPNLTLEQRLTLNAMAIPLPKILTMRAGLLHEAIGVRVPEGWNSSGVTLAYNSFLRWYEKDGNELVYYGDLDFPPLLRTIADPPFGLTYRGDLSHTGLSLSIVGTRNASAKALHAAFTLGLECGAARVLVVSGFARGIDLAAHGGACAIGGPTWAVLGSGLSYINQKSPYKVQRVLACQGAFVSEFHPSAAPLPWRFPIRNRIIAGLSPVTVVVEAPQKSGALITADYALRQGREVLVHRQGGDSSGTAFLIEDGAKVVNWLGEVAAKTCVNYNPTRRAVLRTSSRVYQFGSRKYSLVPSL